MLVSPLNVALGFSGNTRIAIVLGRPIRKLGFGMRSAGASSVCSFADKLSSPIASSLIFWHPRCDSSLKLMAAITLGSAAGMSGETKSFVASATGCCGLMLSWSYAMYPLR